MTTSLQFWHLSDECYVLYLDEKNKIKKTFPTHRQHCDKTYFSNSPHVSAVTDGKFLLKKFSTKNWWFSLYTVSTKKMAKNTSTVYLGFEDEAITEKNKSLVDFMTNKVGGQPVSG